MLSGTSIQLGDTRHDIDWARASRSIRTLKGRVVVEMLPEAESYGSIVLPETVKANCRADIGVALSVPGHWEEGAWISDALVVKGRAITYPAPGTLVVVTPDNGTWIEQADMGAYRPTGQVRAYGVYVKYSGKPRREDWWLSIRAGLARESAGNLKENLRPYGTNIVFELDELQKTQGGILLADESQYRTGMATIVSVGRLERNVKPGDRVCVNIRALKENALNFGFGGGESDKNLWIGDADAIEYVLQPDTAIQAEAAACA